MPKETVAAASLPDDYLQYVHERNSDCECHAYESNDQYVRRCVNNGVPVRTSMSIDVKVMQVLKSAGMEPDVCGTPGGPHGVHEASPDPTSMNHSLLYTVCTHTIIQMKMIACHVVPKECSVVLDECHVMNHLMHSAVSPTLSIK